MALVVHIYILLALWGRKGEGSLGEKLKSQPNSPRGGRVGPPQTPSGVSSRSLSTLSPKIILIILIQTKSIMLYNELCTLGCNRGFGVELLDFDD